MDSTKVIDAMKDLTVGDLEKAFSVASNVGMLLAVGFVLAIFLGVVGQYLYVRWITRND